ncbi:MAG: hypothetical protein KJN99_03535 [Marinicaulis sp.]|nr:hypothetical protein [Marinicaulis sp.]
MRRSIELIIIPIFFLSTACANSSLQRFVPPGIFKYEEIASEKEPNPKIEEIVAARGERVDEKFPILSETPTAGLILERPDKSEAQRQSDIIIDARDELTSAIDADRKASQEERQAVTDLEKRTDDLLEQLERDELSAQGERTEPLRSPQEK